MLKHTFAGGKWKAETEWDKKLRKAALEGEPFEVQLKPHLQVLKKYPNVLSENYWSKWEKREGVLD